MKTSVLTLLAASAALTGFGQEYTDPLTEPITVSNVSMKQLQNQDVIVSYDLQNGTRPAWIGLDIETNGVSIGLDKFKHLSGAVSFVTNGWVYGGTGLQIKWPAREDWRGNLSTNAQAIVTAHYAESVWACSNVYMIVDLSGGPAATDYPVSYTLYPPQTDPESKTSHLWLRRIEPGTVWEGRSDAECGSMNAWFWREPEPWRQITLTNAFFVGVYEMTAAQYQLVTGLTPSKAAKNGEAALCPVDSVSYESIRGSTNEADGINWPTTGARVSTNSFMGLLRAKTGIGTFDLPTESQWEYACRAGTLTSWNNGTQCTNTGYDANCVALGWSGNNSIGKRGYEMQMVGLKLPNGWGLYDMHGNVWEMCLDWTAEVPSGGMDPAGPDSGGGRMYRGGAYDILGAFQCRSGSRGMSSARGINPTNTYLDIGFRVFCRVP